MREGLSRTTLAALLCAIAAALLAQTEVTYFEAVPYEFPAAQGDADQVLTNDGAGTLTWVAPPSPEGLWKNCIVLSTVACPSGWTSISGLGGANSRILRMHATATSTGGADTHTHTASGSIGSTGSGFTLTGFSSTVASLSMSGSTQMDNAAHAHGDTTGSTAAVGGSPPTLGPLTALTVNSYSPIHSHGVGTLAMGSHDHAPGTLAGAEHGHSLGTLAFASASNLPEYYNLIVCRKN